MYWAYIYFQSLAARIKFSSSSLLSRLNSLLLSQNPKLKFVFSPTMARRVEEVYAELMRYRLDPKVKLRSLERQVDEILAARRKNKFTVLTAGSLGAIVGAISPSFFQNMKNLNNSFYKAPKEILMKVCSYLPADNPGLFKDYGKLSRDILNLECSSRFCIVSSVNRNGGELTQSGFLDNRDILGSFSLQLKKKGMLDVIGDIEFTSRNKISGFISLTCEEFAPGLKIFIRGTSDPKNENSIAVEYSRPYIGLNSSVGLLHNHILNCAAVIGTSLFSVGGDILINAIDYNISAWKIGFSFSKDDNIRGSLIFTNVGNIEASYYHCYPDYKLATDFSHVLRTGSTNISVGVEHNLDATSIVKTTVNTLGILKGMLTIFWFSKCSTNFSAEVNLQRVNEAPGLGCVLQWSVC